MKRQTRPFTVEIKSSRKPAPPSLGSSLKASPEWVDPFPNDLPERDIHEDFLPEARSEAFRKAEQLFARVTEPSERVAKVTSAAAEPSDLRLRAPAPRAESHAPRVLPDLFAQARHEERKAEQEPDPQPASKHSPTKAKPKTKPARKRSAPANDELPLESPAPAEKRLVMPAPAGDLPSPATGAMTVVRSGRPSGQLPLGQRWKERRLPRVCWDQPGLRKRQRA